MTPRRTILLVSLREVRERLRSTVFKVSTVILVLVAGGGVFAGDIGPRLLGEHVSRLGVTGDSASQPVVAALASGARELGARLRISAFPDQASGLDALDHGRIDGLLNGDTLVVTARERDTLTVVVNRGLFEARLPSVLQQLGLTLEQARPLLSPQPVQVQTYHQTLGSSSQRRQTAAIATIALYLALALYGSWILVGVVEEKASRIAEVLLCLVRPEELLAGKTVGIVIVAVVQMLLAAAGALVALLAVGAFEVPSFAIGVGAISVFYFLLGLLLYSLMFAAVGSTVTRQAEAGSTAMPLSLLMLAPYMLSLTYVPDHPDSRLSTLLSLVPFSSPLIMPTRVATGSPSPVEVALSLLLLLPAIAFVAWLGGRVYAGAILSNRRVSLLRLLRQSLRSPGLPQPRV